MRVIPIAASVIALGAFLGGLTASVDADAPETVQQRTVAFAPSTDVVVPGLRDNNGNG
jgi:hypothetical protein